MAYDSAAQKLAIKAIGTVESNLNYQAVNYNDPITVGIMQWYGTRAAGILNRIRTENPGSWVNVANSVTADIDVHPVTNSQFWTNRYLSREEGESLKPVLENNRAIQNAQAADDLNGYVDTAVRNGFDKDGNTNAMLFFFVIYHQSPRRALNLVSSLGPQSDIDRLYVGTTNEPVLSSYTSRYARARDIIKSGDSSGVDDVPGTVEPPVEEPDDNGQDTGTSAPEGPVKYLEVVGDNVLIHLKSGGKIWAYPYGANRLFPGGAIADPNTGGALPPPPPNPNPELPPTAPPSDVAAALVDFVVSRIGNYAYSQGSTRLTPDSHMRTDCSALMNFAYKSVANMDIGTYTGNQFNKGQSIYSGPGSGLTEAIMRPADLVFNGNSSAKPKHVEMYIGNGETCGHGGPGAGPITKPLSIRFGQPWIWVRRHV